MWAEVRHGGWPGYAFRLTFSAGDLSGVEVRRDDGSDPLTAQRLQRVPLGALERGVRKHVNVFENLWSEVVASSAGLANGKVVHVGKAGMSPALSEWFDSYHQAKPSREQKLARLSERYVETLDEPGQTAMLAEEFSYAPASIAAMIREARNKHKLLTPTRQGKPGGSLTPKARAILAEREEELKRRIDGQATRQQ
jgi:hypothetical protein